MVYSIFPALLYCCLTQTSWSLWGDLMSYPLWLLVTAFQYLVFWALFLVIYSVFDFTITDISDLGAQFSKVWLSSVVLKLINKLLLCCISYNSISDCYITYNSLSVIYNLDLGSILLYILQFNIGLLYNLQFNIGYLQLRFRIYSVVYPIIQYRIVS